MKCPFCESTLPDPAAACPCGQDPFTGNVLGSRYLLIGLIGRGGMATICRAVDLQTQQIRAIKISTWCDTLQEVRQLAPAQAAEEEEARVKREFTLLKKASTLSEHIVKVYDKVALDPQMGIFYPMEVLDGLPLEDREEWKRPMPPRMAVDILLQICDGISIAHGLGVVHRDLSPGNIFLIETPEQPRFVKIIDFGIARSLYERHKLFQTDDDMAFGSLEYVAPEQTGYSAKTDDFSRETAAGLDHRADIYAIGVMFFRMLTGATPFDDNSIEGIATRDWHSPRGFANCVDPDTIPMQLEPLIMSCIHPDPDGRPPDLLVLSDLLREALDELPEELGAAKVRWGSDDVPSPMPTDPDGGGTLFDSTKSVELVLDRLLDDPDESTIADQRSMFHGDSLPSLTEPKLIGGPDLAQLKVAQASDEMPAEQYDEDLFDESEPTELELFNSGSSVSEEGDTLNRRPPTAPRRRVAVFRKGEGPASDKKSARDEFARSAHLANTRPGAVSSALPEIPEVEPVQPEPEDDHDEEQAGYSDEFIPVNELINAVRKGGSAEDGSYAEEDSYQGLGDIVPSTVGGEDEEELYPDELEPSVQLMPVRLESPVAGDVAEPKTEPLFDPDQTDRHMAEDDFPPEVSAKGASFTSQPTAIEVEATEKQNRSMVEEVIDGRFAARGDGHPNSSPPTEEEVVVEVQDEDHEDDALHEDEDSLQDFVPVAPLPQYDDEPYPKPKTPEDTSYPKPASPLSADDGQQEEAEPYQPPIEPLKRVISTQSRLSMAEKVLWVALGMLLVASLGVFGYWLSSLQDFLASL